MGVVVEERMEDEWTASPRHYSSLFPPLIRIGHSFGFISRRRGGKSDPRLSIIIGAGACFGSSVVVGGSFVVDCTFTFTTTEERR